MQKKFLLVLFSFFLISGVAFTQENIMVGGDYFSALPTYSSVKKYEFDPFGESLYWGGYLYELRWRQTLFYDSLKFRILEERYRQTNDKDSFLSLFNDAGSEYSNISDYNALVIFSDEEEDRKHRFVLSNSILAKFDPFFLNKEFSGLLWEYNDLRNNITCFLSMPETGRNLYRYYNKYLLAANYEIKIFENLRAGVSFANSHEEYGAPTGLEGKMENIASLEKVIYLKIYDSASDNYGAMIDGTVNVSISTDKEVVNYSFTVGQANELNYLIQIGDVTYDAPLELGVRNAKGSTYILYRFVIPEGKLLNMNISAHIYSTYPMGTTEENERELNGVVVAISNLSPADVKSKTNLDGYVTVPKSDWIDGNINIMDYIDSLEPAVKKGYYLPGVTNYGFYLKLALPGLLDTRLNYSIVHNIQNRVNVTSVGGYREDKSCNAYSFNLGTNLGGYESYQIDEGYDASDFVDNDRNRYVYKADSSLSYDPLNSYKIEIEKNEEISFPAKLDLDLNRNGIPDFQDDFLLFDCDQDFLPSKDIDLNGVNDLVEKIGEPIYGHRTGRKGSHIYGQVPFGGFLFKIGAHNENNTTDSLKKKGDFYLNFQYNKRIDFINLDTFFQYNYQKTNTNLTDRFLKTGPNGRDIDNDSIDSDNDGYCDGQERRDGTNPIDSSSYPVIPIEDFRYWIDEEDEIGKYQEDDMALRDANISQFVVALRWQGWKDFSSEMKYKFNTIGNYFDGSVYKNMPENFLVLKLKQDFYPLSNLFFTPMYKMEKRVGVSTPFGYSPGYDSLSHIGILKTTFKLMKNTSLIFGLEGINYTDNKDSWYNYNSGALSLEVICRGRIGSASPILVVGWTEKNINYTDSSHDDKKEREIMVRILM